MRHPTIHLITSEQGFSELQSEWNALYQRLGYNLTICQTWDWNYSWFTAFKRHVDSLAIFVCMSESRVCGLLPLVLHKRAEANATPHAQFLGAWHSDYHDWLVEEPYALHFLDDVLGALQALHVTRVSFTDIPHWSSLAQALARVAAARALAVTSGVSAVCPYITLPDSWSAYLESRTTKMRKTILNAQRHGAQQQSAFHVCQSRRDLANYQACFLELHDRWWIKKATQVGEPSALADPDMRHFLCDVTERLFARGALHFSMQRNSNDMISAFIAFHQHQALGYYLSGVNPDYAPHSPGVAHIAHLIEYAIAHGHTAFDFLRGDEAYKFRRNSAVSETHWYDVALHTTIHPRKLAQLQPVDREPVALIAS